VRARFVPHLLKPDQNHQRAASSVEIVEMIYNDRCVLKWIVTGDESWCFMYDPETKRQSANGWSPKKPKAQKVRTQKSRVKTILTAFFMLKVSFVINLCRKKQTVNGKFYKEVIKRLVARVHRVKPEFQESWSWYLLYCTAPAHSSGAVSEFLAKRGIPVLSHPSHSPDLSPADFFYFLN
jgi:hypothetical protein